MQLIIIINDKTGSKYFGSKKLVQKKKKSILTIKLFICLMKRLHTYDINNYCLRQRAI